MDTFRIRGISASILKYLQLREGVLFASVRNIIPFEFWTVFLSSRIFSIT